MAAASQLCWLDRSGPLDLDPVAADARERTTGGEWWRTAADSPVRHGIELGGSVSRAGHTENC
jgi:hypothetical protein